MRKLYSPEFCSGSTFLEGRTGDVPLCSIGTNGELAGECWLQILKGL